MSTARLINRPNKTAPIGADIVFLGDSTNSYNEVYSTISQLIGNNKIPTFTGSITAGNLTLWNDSTTQKDSGIAVDGSRNLTNVGTINGYNLANFLVSSNNLSDLNNVSTARTNLGLGSAATKNASSSDSTVAAVHGTITPGHVAYFYDSAGTLVDGGTTSQFLQVTNNLNDVQSKSASRINLSVPAATAYDGNPNGNVAGTLNDLCQDTLTQALYMCSTTGSASTAVWSPVLNLAGVLFKINNLSDVQNTTTAFNNISPLTTKGDLIVYDGSNNVRLAGSSTNNYVLTYDNTQPQNLKWAPIPGQGDQIRVISTTTTLTSADFGSTIICEGNTSYTVTLPTANSGTNKFIYFVFDTGQQVFVNIVGQGSDYIIGPGPNNPNYLFGTGEYLQMMSDGTTWLPSSVLQPCDFTGGLTNSFSSTNSFQPVPFNLVSKNNMVYDAVTGYVTPIYPGRYRITVQMTAPQNASQYSQAVGVSVIGDKYYYAGNTPVTNASATNSITFTREFSFPGTGTAPGNGTFAPVYQSTLNLTLGGAGGDAINFMSIVRVSNY